LTPVTATPESASEPEEIEKDHGPLCPMSWRNLGRIIDESTQLEQLVANKFFGDFGEALDTLQPGFVKEARMWPKSYMKLLYQKKKYETRFTLFMFITRNGMPPHEAAVWTMAAGASKYDVSAWRHILGLANDEAMGKLNKYKTFDMKAGKMQ